ncbi:MAG: hypothetical protein ROM54_02785 [Anaerobiospirillum sp.]|nr:hypothetical protein [Anaerobiospirillum sp.]
MANRDQLSLRELELLQELNEIAAKTDALNQSIEEKLQSLDKKDMEIEALKRELAAYKEENEQLKELISTWRQRMDNILKQLGQLN